MFILLSPLAQNGNSNSSALQLHIYGMKHRIDQKYLMPGQNDNSSTFEY
ncbi:hypothetical protein DSOL_2816 [Desulfosporosinus metallidurans]|uniref:Uncharacterized protein n=1 Tax=Desulfosporosinus metallidurans TaxID=1888891 RepID=A0A1Q8QV45_9FIRM|nr:hypothetical protein DSOL_2816 [Desulfosporosinus metallidurans]